MSDNPFHTAQVKVRRAKVHIGGIGPQIDVVIEQHNAFLSALSHSSPFVLLPELSIPETQLDELACCVGDAIHNLRSALDLLACEVVERSGGSPNGVHFPFAQTAAKLGDQVKGKNFHRARADAKALHLTLGPHGESHGNRFLWGLHRLDLIDKHQDLLALSSDHPTPGVFTEGVHLKPEDYQPARLIFSASSPLAGEGIETVLVRIADEVEAVITAFKNLKW